MEKVYYLKKFGLVLNRNTIKKRVLNSETVTGAFSFAMKFSAITIFILLFATSTIVGQTINEKVIETDFPIFWLLRDGQIENHQLIEKEFGEIVSAGFEGVHVMLRATRYHIFDQEVIAASKKISELCKAQNIYFTIGLDPRFGARHIVGKTGYGAEILMPIADYFTPVNNYDGLEKAATPERFKLHEVKVVDSRYDLRYKYPERRDSHILTEVGLWYNPLKVEKVFAYQRKNGKVISSSVTEITESHHLFINRSAYQLEVFGKVKLPPGDWYVVAFPRFMTNMYAYDSKEHKSLFQDLLVAYKNKGVEPDGIVWDEPGYYVEFGKFVISASIYQQFYQKYGYKLSDKLYALILEMDDHSQIKVRNDYFNLLMDQVYAGEKECWNKSEELWGPIKMGAHQTWHNIVSDDMFHGSASMWKGLRTTDGGYTDLGMFEEYFTGNTEDKYFQAAYVVLAKSLARYSRTGKAHMNQWGVNYDDEVPLYWSELLAAFSVNWINHCYGYTGTIYADRNFGPGYPDHHTWDVIPDVVKKEKKVEAITNFDLPLGDVALVYPVESYISGAPIPGSKSEKSVLRLIGGLAAKGMQLDVISSEMLDTAKVSQGKLTIGKHIYNSVLIPDNKILTAKSVKLLSKMIEQKANIFFGGELPQFTIEGDPVNLGVTSDFSLLGNIEKTLNEIARLEIPSICSGLKGAYVNIIPTAEEESYFITIMPIVPGAEVGGEIMFKNRPIAIDTTKKLVIYKVNNMRINRVY